MAAGVTPDPGPNERLDSWKEIAAYLKRGVRTVRRWEESEGLPVRRHTHGQRGSVYAYRSELDAWWHGRSAGPEPPPVEEQPVSTGRRAGWIVAGSSLAMAAIWATWIAARPPAPPRRPARISPFTTDVGVADQPALSPDSTRVAYRWGIPKSAQAIFVKVIGAQSSFRLAPGSSPVWSSDGTKIAFLRHLPRHEGVQTVSIVPAPGGVDQAVAEIALDRGPGMGTDLTWLADGKWLIASDGHPPGLVLLSVLTGEKRRLTNPDPSLFKGDYNPAVSPAQDEVAFVRHIGGTSDVYRLRLTRDLHPGSQPERLTFLNRNAASPAWSPDGRALFFSDDEPDRGRRMWRVALSGNRSVEPLDAFGEGVRDVAVRGNRLVYSRAYSRSHIWAVDVESAHVGPPTPLITSARSERNPQYSPDGTQIAFQSNRSGGSEIWTCSREGAQCRQLTFLGSEISGLPQWSPDGKQIAFHSRLEGFGNILVVPANGGPVRRVTSGRNEDYAPSWSRDGTTIYFGSIRSGESQIWKVPAEGGQPVRVTKGGGNVALESPDGQFLYYTKSEQAGIWRLPVKSGDETLFLAQQRPGTRFALTRQGVYFLAGEDQSFKLQFWPFSGSHGTVICSLEAPTGLGLAASPDGRRILYTRADPLQSDLMLAEGVQ